MVSQKRSCGIVCYWPKPGTPEFQLTYRYRYRYRCNADLGFVSNK